MFRRKLPAEFGSLSLYTSTEGGLRYLASTSDQFDPTLYSEVRTYVHPGHVVWDIGANVGLFTMAAASRAGRTGQVVAIEPDTWLVALLRRSVRHNHKRAASAAPISVLPVAISDHSGVSEFCIARRNRSTSHLVGFGTTQTGGERERLLVPTMTIDDLLEHFPAPDVLKIDVEGAEVEALTGAAKVLSHLPVVLCEVAGANAQGVHDILGPLGYRYLDAERDVMTDLPLSENTIALPPNTELRR